MEKKQILGGALAISFALVGIPAAATAQGMGAQPEQPAAPQPQQPQQQAPDTDFSDAEISQFTEAYAKVEEIGQELNAELSDVQDPEKAREIQQEGYQKMHAAVEGAGMDPETYNAIASAINTDPELQARVMEELGHR